MRKVLGVLPCVAIGDCMRPGPSSDPEGGRGGIGLPACCPEIRKAKF